MRIDAFELRRLRLPLVTPFRTSFGTQTERDVLLLRALSPEGEGWGECVAMAAPLYSPEYADGAHHVIREHLLPRLLSVQTEDGITAAQVAPMLSPVKGHSFAKAAIEMALLDLELRVAGQSLAAYLGGDRPLVDCGVSIGIQSSVEALLEAVGGYVAEGYRRVKLKIEPGHDHAPVAAVRSAFPTLPLQVDANTAYGLDDWAQLAALDEFGLLLIEQPLPEDELVAHAELARRVRTPICLDESIVSEAVARDALDLDACSVINIKPGRCGGYLAGKRIHDLCRARSVPVWMGGMLETGIGRAANLALAALPGFTLPGDISASARYFERDVIRQPFVMEAGQLRVPVGPGLGVEVDLPFIDSVTSFVELVPSP